jgi:hypothetical protein
LRAFRSPRHPMQAGLMGCKKSGIGAAKPRL